LKGELQHHTQHLLSWECLMFQLLLFGCSFAGITNFIEILLKTSKLFHLFNYT